MDAAAAKPPLTHKDLRLVVWGVLLPLFMGSIDQTILASALPTIGRDFGDVHNLPWLITIYLLASTAGMPLYGKLADIHGRAFTLRIAIVAHMAGSLICALAPDMFVLILGRAIQGIGGAGLSGVSVVVLGDVAAPKERGKYYAYFSITYTTAGACGPALGGFLSDHVHWSAIFWLNIPLEIIALLLVTRLLRRLPRYERPHRLDLLGAATSPSTTTGIETRPAAPMPCTMRPKIKTAIDGASAQISEPAKWMTIATQSVGRRP